MHIIPAIDIIEGKCVRLAQGQYASKTVYDAQPLEMALRFADAGFSRLHLVDLDGARQKRVVNYKVLETIASKVESLHIDFGGGIQTDEDIRIIFECGARQVTVGSIAVKNKDLFLRWLTTFGSEKIILASDVREGTIAVHGWEEATQLPVVDFITENHMLGVRYTMCTDISKDGMLMGTAHELYQTIREACPDVQLIASGGVSSLQDIEKLRDNGLFGAIIGKVLYEGRLQLQELRSLFV